MARQDINEALAQTGFLYGGNAAYIEDLYARYEADPKPVDANGELVSALDGNWAVVEKVISDKLGAKAKAAGTVLSAADVQQATRDSVRAIMLIRAYRMRGHLHA